MSASESDTSTGIVHNGERAVGTCARPVHSLGAAWTQRSARARLLDPLEFAYPLNPVDNKDLRILQVGREK